MLVGTYDHGTSNSEKNLVKLCCKNGKENTLKQWKLENNDKTVFVIIWFYNFYTVVKPFYYFYEFWKVRKTA